MEEVFQKLPTLKVLYLHNNEITKKIPNYRKAVIAKLTKLTYLDDRPVIDEDRRNAEAFSRGGWDAEREERDKIKKEKDEQRERYH
jgi:dynein assembly factor 1